MHSGRHGAPRTRGVKPTTSSLGVLVVKTSCGALACEPSAPHGEQDQFPGFQQRICQLSLLKRCLPAKLARKEARLLLAGLNVPADQAFQIEEAVAELATNAESYTPPPWQMRVYLDHRWLWLGVFDADARTTRSLRNLLRGATRPELLQEHGRGLYLVREACSGACWVRPALADAEGALGKEVLLRFPLPPHTEGATAAA